MSAILPAELQRLLAANLTSGHSYTFHHLSSTPAECDPIFAAPPGGAPESTTWESQLLSVSIEQGDSLIQVFAIEVLIYSTDRQITLFVSKADSTGYTHLARLPKIATSPVRSITSAFLEYLIMWKRGRRRLVLSLFARAQPQYLFPGSSENSAKHVLDDRQLVRWWCRIVDEALGRIDAGNRSATKIANGSAESAASTTATGTDINTKAYLVIPGLDAHEVRTYTPRGSTRWLPGQSPLKQLALNPDVPERCLIPRFPDDPKTRFTIDLDDELPENAIQLGDVTEAPEPSKTGKWRSVRSLEQFWELMAFRQECAAGRVVGFLWAVFDPVHGSEASKAGVTETIKVESENTGVLSTAETAQINGESLDDPKNAVISPDLQHPGPQTDSLAGKELEAAVKPKFNNDPASTATDTSTAPPTAEPSPAPVPAPLPQSDGSPAPLPAPIHLTTALLVPAAKYATIMSLLEKLDYADIALAKISSNRFFTYAAEQAGLSPGKDSWGIAVAGERMDEAYSKSAAAAETKTENAPMLLVGRKRKKEKPAATSEIAKEEEKVEETKRVKAG